MRFLELENLDLIPVLEIYDLSKVNYVYNDEVAQRYKNLFITVSPGLEMRIDLVCQEIYENNDHCDFLLLYNNIDSMLNIREGAEIKYVPINDIKSFMRNKASSNRLRETILTRRNENRVDVNRIKYLSTRGELDVNSLPPSVTERDYNPVKYKDGKIIIGENIFGV